MAPVPFHGENRGMAQEQDENMPLDNQTGPHLYGLLATGRWNAADGDARWSMKSLPNHDHHAGKDRKVM